MLSKAFKAVFLIGALFFAFQGHSQCFHCSAPSAPSIYGGTFNVTMYKNAKVQLWAAKPSVAVDARQWYRVKKAGDTTFVGNGDTMAFTMDTTSRFLCRNVNNCTCGGTYYSTYTQIASITVVDSPSVPQYWFTYDSVICSGSPTNIFTYTNSSLSGLNVQYLRDDTPNVTGSLTGSAALGPLGVTLTNTTGTAQVVRIVLRLFKGTTYFDSKSFYVKVLPGSPSGSDHCSFPTKPNPWPNGTVDAGTYGKGAHVQFLADTTVAADTVKWYKVVGSDTSFIGKGYYISVTIDTSAKYLARNVNVCACNGSTYQSAYSLVANITASSGYVSHIIPLQMLDSIASGTGIDIVPKGDTSLKVTMNFFRDNANVSGSTNQYTITNYSSVSGVLDMVLTNTTNVPQRVRYRISSVLYAVSGAVLGDTYVGYLTVMPSSLTAPAGNHCFVPDRPSVVTNSVITLSKGATVYLDLHNATYDVAGTPAVNFPTADILDWYKSKGPGDTTYLGNVTPISTVVDTSYRTFAVSRNVCYWSDSSRHIYTGAVQPMTALTAGSLAVQAISSRTNTKPNLCYGDSAYLTFTKPSSAAGVYWYRSNVKNVTGITGATTGATTLTARPALADTVNKPQKVYFVSYASNGSTFSSQTLDSVTVYPDCSKWSNFSTAIHASRDSICPGDTATLTADTVPGLGNHYAWSMGDTTKTIHPTNAGTYTVTVSNSCGCTATASFTITIKPAAELFINTSGTICSGDSGIILATGSGEYSWSTGDTLSAIVVRNSGNYTVTAKNSYGCKSIATIPVSIKSNPSVYAGRDTFVCAGESMFIGNMDSVLSGTPPYNYHWEPSAYVSNSSMYRPYATPPISGPFILTVTDSNGCKGADTLFLLVRKTPIVNAGRDSLLQEGSTITLGDTVISYTPLSSVFWNPGFEMQDPSVLHPILSPGATASYVEVAIDSFGCQGRDSVIITVLANPDSSWIIAFSDTSIGVVDSLAFGDTITVRTRYMNIGAFYSDSITIYQDFACDSCVKVRRIRIFSAYAASPDIEIQNPVFPLSLPLSLGSYLPLRVEQDIYLGYDSCLPFNGCTARQSLRYRSLEAHFQTAQIPITIFPASNARIPAGLEVVINPKINDCATGASGINTGLYEITVSSSNSVLVTNPFSITISGLKSPINTGFLPTPANWTIVQGPGGTSLILTYTPPSPAVGGLNLDYVFEQGSLQCISGSLETVGSNSVTISNTPYTAATMSVEVPGYGGTIVNPGDIYFYNYPGAPQYPSSINHANLRPGTTPTVNVVGVTTIASVGVSNASAFPYIGDITVSNSGGCPSMVLRSISIVVNNIVLSTISIAPYTFHNIAIPAHTNFTIREEFDYTGSLCQQINCSRITPSILWGCCPTSTTLNDIIFRSTPISPPQLAVTRMNSDWEAVCPGDQTAWEFKVTNAGGAAQNIKAVLDMGLLESNTYILENSIQVSDGHNQAIGFTLLNTDYLTASDYTNANLNTPACLLSLLSVPNAPIQQSTININQGIGRGDELRIKFKTYKCCPSDLEFKSRYFNQVTLKVSGQGCNNQWYTAAPTPSGNISPEGVNTTNNGVYNFGLEQYAVPDILDMAARAGNCSNYYDFKVENRIFNNPSNNPVYPSRNAFSGGDANDAMLYCSASGDPGGRFKVKVDWTGNLFADPISSNFYIEGAHGGIWTPSPGTWVTVSPPTNTSAGYLEAVFDIDELILPSGQHPASNTDFKEFFVGSTIHFGLRTCCDNPVAYPTITASTSFDFDAYSSCTDHCWTGLSQVTFHPSVRCPGCKTPGMLITEYTLERTTLGFEDINNNGRPESGSSTTPTLQPWNFSALTNVERGQLKLNRSMKGDILLSTATGVLYGGDTHQRATYDPNDPNNPAYLCGNHAFTIAEWEAQYPGKHLDFFYLEQVIDNASRVGLTILPPTAPALSTTTIDYFAGGNTAVAPISVNISAASIFQSPVIGPNFATRFVFEVSAADFGTLHFGPDDLFVVRTQYSVCTSPVSLFNNAVAENLDLRVRNRMFVAPTAVSNPMDPFNSHTALASDVFTNHCDDLGSITPTSDFPYFCQGFDISHRVFGLQIGRLEQFDNGTQCSKKFTLHYDETVLADPNMTNVFPYEYRLVPGLDVNHLDVGLGILGPPKKPMQALINPTNTPYIYYPDHISTLAHVYNGQNTTGLQSWTLNTGQIAFASGPPDVYCLDVTRAIYMPYFEGLTNSSINITGGNQLGSIGVVTQNNNTTLLIGDEGFYQDFVFRLETNCDAPPTQSLDVTPADADNYVRVPDIAACSPDLINGWGTRNDLDVRSRGIITATVPNMYIPPALSPPTYSNAGVTFAFTMYSDYAPHYNLIIREDGHNHPVDAAGNVIQGVTVSVLNGTSITPSGPINNGLGYYGYSLDPLFNNHSSASISLNVLFKIDDCSSVDLNLSNTYSEILKTVPMWVTWDCHEIDWDDFNPNHPTLCNTPIELDASFNIYNPLFRLSSTILHDPWQYTGCAPERVVMCAYNSGGRDIQSNLGAVGNVKFEVTVPLSVNVDASNTTFSIGTGAQTTVPSGSISTPVTSGSDHTYTIDLSNSTSFTSAQVGGNGFEQDDGDICLQLSLLPGCNATGPISVSFNASADPYCAPTGGNRVDAELTPLSINIIPTNITLCNPPVLTATPHDVSCNGASNSGSIDLSVTGGLATYQYSLDGTNFTSFATSATTATISGLTSGSYIVTIKDANGCLTTATANISVSGGISITSTDAHGACPGIANGYITFGLTGVSPYSYAWNNGTAGTGLTGLAAGTYHLTITDANGCTATATVDVNSLSDCCTPSYPDLTQAQNDALVFNVISITSTDFLSDLSAAGFSSYVSGNALVNFPYQVVIMGTLDMDDDLSFINCPNITFNLNGSILTNGHVLVIQGSQLYSCGPDMWGGIGVYGTGAEIDVMPPVTGMGPTEIRDARIAIDLSGAASVDVGGGSFISNWGGIYYDGSAGLGHFRIANATFTSYVDASGNTSIKNLFLPTTMHSPSRAYIGVQVSNLPPSFTNLRIGDVNMAPNTFGYVECGIKIASATATIVNNQFTHVQEGPTFVPSLYPHVGSCIYASTYPSALAAVNMNIDIESNTFSSGLYGIRTDGRIRNTTINNNDFTGPVAYGTHHTGVWVANNLRGQYVNITNNTMGISGTDRLIDRGILVTNAAGTRINITDNIISTVNYALHNASSNTMRPTIAIDIEGVRPANPFGSPATIIGATIVNNHITDAQYGIKTVYCAKFRITDNSIGIYAKAYAGNVTGTPKWCGILTRICQGMFVGINNIDCDYRSEAPTYVLSGPNFTADKLVGILIDQQSGTNTFSCNQVSNGHWGIVAKGPSNQSAQSLNANTVDNCIVGDLSLSLGWFGTQGGTPLTSTGMGYSSNDNQWTNMAGTSQHRLGVVNQTYTSIAAQQTFYARRITTYDPQPSGTTQFLFPNLGLSPNPFPIVSGGSRAITTCTAVPSIDRIALAVSENRSFYEAVAQRTIAMDSTDVDSFYTRRWMELGLLSMSLDYPDMLDSSSILRDTVAAMLTRPEGQLAYINYTMIADSTDSMISAHLTANAAITPMDDWQKKLKAVNYLYLKHFAVPDTTQADTLELMDSRGKEQLLSIATSCAYTGGPAVYQAQALYWAAADTLEFFDDMECESGDSLRRAYVHFQDDTVVAAIPYSFRLYPTLISINGTFQTVSSEASKIVFYKALGQLVYKASIQKGTTLFDCRALGCPNEILLYKAQLDNGRMEGGKIVITK